MDASQKERAPLEGEPQANPQPGDEGNQSAHDIAATQTLAATAVAGKSLAEFFANLPKTPAEAALAYAEHGWRILPLHSMRMIDGALRCSCGHDDCEAPGKHPMVKSGDASNDVEKIKAWWKKWPHANIGFWLEGSGLAVLDVDIGAGKDGAARLREILKDHPLPETLVCATPSGGKHIYFNDREGLPNKSNALGGGLDIWRGKHYVILPPSNHKAGGNYVWERANNDIAPWPDILMPEKRGPGRPPDPNKKSAAFEISNEDDVARLKYALTFNDGTDRKTWYQTVFAIARAFNWSEAGFEIANEWSAQARNHSPKLTHRYYFRDSKNEPADGAPPVTVASIFERAKQHPNYTPWESKDDRPFIFRNRPESLGPSLDELTEIVVAAKVPIYQRSGIIVDITKVDSLTEAERERLHRLNIDAPPGTPILRELSPGRFEDVCSPSIAWQEKRGKKWRSIPYRRTTCQDFLNRKRWVGIKQFRSFQFHPGIRSLDDRSIISAPGLDEKSGLYLVDTFPLSMPSGPLDLRHARAAESVILAPFADFGFLNRKLGPAVVLAAVITSVTRHCYPTVPGVAVEAARAKSGKTIAAQAMGAIALGRRLPTTSYTSDDEEMEKRIGAFKSMGIRDLLLDNVKDRMESRIIEMLMTSERVVLRILGKSEGIEIINDGMLYITGNGMTMSPDMRRRFLTLTIDSGEQDQAERQGKFKFDPPTKALEMRREIIAAVLTIIKAFEDSGGRQKLDRSDGTKDRRPVASFEDWSYVRDILLWLGYPDLGAALAENLARDDDENSYDKDRVLAWMVQNGNGLSASEIAARLTTSMNDEDIAVRGIFIRGKSARAQGRSGDSLSGEVIAHGLRRLCLLDASWPLQMVSGAIKTVRLTKLPSGKYSALERP